MSSAVACLNGYRVIPLIRGGMKSSDAQLDRNVATLREHITAWAIRNNLWHDCGFKSYLDHVGGEQSEEPIVTILWHEGDFRTILDGYDEELYLEFESILASHGFQYEQYNHFTIYIYPRDDNVLAKNYADYERWKWICSIVEPDISDVYEELYSYFFRYPERLHDLGHRQFEILLFRIFQSQGFNCELGPGSGDGGIDIRLLQRDPLGDILTVVQAKRYAPHNKIGLGPVQALHGAADVEGAQSSIIVTTSDYQPAARKWAPRTRIPMKLATSQDVKNWCADASDGIVRDKSKLISLSSVSNILRSLSPKDSRLVCSSRWGSQPNQFAVVLKETRYAALLMAIPSTVLTHDGYGQRGLVVPDAGENALNMFGPDTVFRVRRQSGNGSVRYWDGHDNYYIWDGQPKSFDYYD